MVTCSRCLEEQRVTDTLNRFTVITSFTIITMFGSIITVSPLVKPW